MKKLFLLFLLATFATLSSWAATYTLQSTNPKNNSYIEQCPGELIFTFAEAVTDNIEYANFYVHGQGELNLDAEVRDGNKVVVNCSECTSLPTGTEITCTIKLNNCEGTFVLHFNISAAPAVEDYNIAEGWIKFNRNIILVAGESAEADVTQYSETKGTATLTLDNADNTRLLVTLPEGLQPGAYKLHINIGTVRSASSEDYFADSYLDFTVMSKSEADAAAANAVVDKINAIGTVENSEVCGKKINDARTAYDALTDDQKALITEAQYKVLTDAEKAYKTYLEQIVAKSTTYKPYIEGYFKDAACTELKDDFASMNDEGMLEVMTADGLPVIIQNMVIGIKNKWSGEYNSEMSERFRIQNYNLYPTAASTEKWGQTLFDDFNGPTGIVAEQNQLIYVFVGDNVPANTSLSLVRTSNAGLESTTETLATDLKKGVNMILNNRNNAYLWIMRTTTDNSVKVSEQSALKIHIEGGYAMGYADLAGLSETDAKADYSYMLTYANGLAGAKNISKNRIFPVLGNTSETLFALSAQSKIFTNDNIYESVNNFDELVMAYHNSIGITDEVYSDYIKCYTPVSISNVADDAAYSVTSLALQLGAPNDTEAFSAKDDAVNYAYDALTEAEKQMIDPTLVTLMQFAKITATLNSKGLATFSAGRNLCVKTSGVKAYKAAVSDETITLTELNGYIPAGTGVMLSGEAGTTVEFESPAAGATAADVTGNDLKATTLAGGSLATLEANSWALKGDEFLQYTASTYTANKAYLIYKAGGNAKSMNIVFADETTGISNVQSTLKNGKFIENGSIVIMKNGMKYNTAGQHMK